MTIDFFNLDAQKKTLLVIGGSLGARMINTIIEEHLPLFETNNVQVIWQTGKLYYDEYKKYDQNTGIQTHAFLNRMDLAYAGADFIISRAGAGSISELCIVGKPVLFIPSPNVAEDHQTKNAQAIVSKQAALMLKESDKATFKDVFTQLIDDKNQILGENIKVLALPDATKTIADEAVKLIKRKL